MIEDLDVLKQMMAGGIALVVIAFVLVTFGDVHNEAVVIVSVVWLTAGVLSCLYAKMTSDFMLTVIMIGRMMEKMSPAEKKEFEKQFMVKK